MISTGKVKVLGLLALPLVVLAVAVMVFSWGHSSSTTVQAQDDGVEFEIQIPAAFGCSAGKCDVAEGADFDVEIHITDVSGLTNGLYNAIAATLNYTGDLTSNGAMTVVWDECAFPAGSSGAGFENASCAVGIGAPASGDTGVVITGSFNCPVDGSGTLDLLMGSADTKVINDKGVNSFETDDDDLINVNCIFGYTPTPPPPTPTPPDYPPMVKAPALQNVFLTRQGDKIPPVNCLAGDNAAVLTEQIPFLPAIADPKDPESVMALGAFEFDIHYDDDKVCVVIVPEVGDICIVEDSSNSLLEGVARVGCVMVGKDDSITEPFEPGGDPLILATISVYPQPDVYSQAKPNQDNGVVVQLNNVGCELADLQGHPLPVFSCEDADVTFRYLEGDVIPDCVVDALDSQSVAFRWGAEKGSLAYADFMNLEPSGTQADDDIDIKDLQFVFGRFGSTCEEPHPPQEPVNPKG